MALMAVQAGDGRLVSMSGPFDVLGGLGMTLDAVGDRQLGRVSRRRILGQAGPRQKTEHYAKRKNGATEQW
jgi:hypothetical protein